MIEIRTCESEISEVADFTTGVWRETFAGKRLTLKWDESFFEWQVFNSVLARDYLIAAYDGARLVGTMFAEPFRLRLHDREHEATMSSWLTVNPEYRRSDLASKIVSEMRQRHLDRDAAFQIGFGLTGTIGSEFWRSIPDCYRVRGMGYWCLLLNVSALNDSLFLSRFERSAASLLRVLQTRTPRAEVHEGIRPYRPEDLPRCLELANELGTGMDLAYVWDPARLALQLDFKGSPRTIVCERNGRVEGFVNYYPIDCIGKTTVKSAIVDLVVVKSLTREEQKNLLRTCIAQMAAEGIAFVLLLRLPCFPSWPLLKAGFIPLPDQFNVLCGWPQPGLNFDNVKKMYLHVR